MGPTSNSLVDASRRNLLITAAAISGAALLPRTARAAAAPPVANAGTNADLERFIADCIAANGDSNPQGAVLEVLAKAVHDPNAMLRAVGEPQEAGLKVFHRSEALTIFSATWTPQMNLMPHNHLLWANVGIYTGREDNILWRPTPMSIEAFGAKALFAGDVVSLPKDVIHSVTNPLLRYTGSMHIYGGDFFGTTARSQWNPETLAKEPSDGATIRHMFELENERMRARSKS